MIIGSVSLSHQKESKDLFSRAEEWPGVKPQIGSGNRVNEPAWLDKGLLWVRGGEEL